MKNHLELSDLEFMRQFIACELDSGLFNHEAHVRLVWINVRKVGVEQALKNVPNQISAYVEHLGEVGIYNHTLTIAAVKVVYHFMLKSKSDSFSDFIMEFPQLNSNFKGLIELHYSTTIYTNKQAKEIFVEPDLLAFDI